MIDGDDDSYDDMNKDLMRKRWYNADGENHRDDDLPAVIYADGAVFYYKNDKLHRDGDLPAIIYTDGSVRYYKYGVFQKC